MEDTDYTITFWLLTPTHTLRTSNHHHWGWYGYFQESHNSKLTHDLHLWRRRLKYYKTAMIGPWGGVLRYITVEP